MTRRMILLAVAMAVAAAAPLLSQPARAQAGSTGGNDTSPRRARDGGL